MIKIFLITTWILATSVLASAQPAEPASLFDVSALPAKIINPIMKSHPDLFASAPTPEEMDKILSVIYLTNEFETLKIEKINDKYVITGHTYRLIASIEVTGENKLSESAILSALDISAGEKFIFQDVYEGAQRIKDLYGKNGYFNTTVSIDPRTASQNRIHLQISIVENEPCLVKRIDFNTKYDDLNTEITRKTKKYIGRPVTEDTILDIENNVKDFFLDNRILSASIQGPFFEYNDKKTEAYVSYTLENTYKYILNFEGNKYFSSAELSSKLDIDNKIQFGSNPTAEISSRLEKIYLSYGFSHVSIHYNEVVQPNSFLRKAYFTIDEGARTFVKSIRVNGKFSRDPKYYVKIFKDTYDSSIYRQDQVKVAQNSIIEELQNQGYLKAHFLSAQTNFSNNNQSADISIFLDEGPQTLIRSIQFNGAKAFSNYQLKELIGLNEKAPLNLKSVETSLQKITEYYQSQGYLDMEMKSQLSGLMKYSDDNKQADIVYNIYEGPQVHVAKIIIEGNSKTKDYVILNQLAFDSGDTLTPQEISDSEYQLQKTGLFSHVNISTIEKGTQIANRTVLIHVNERNPGLFKMGLGVNTEFNFTLRGYVGTSYNNIGGTARTIYTRLELDRVEGINFVDHTLTLGYQEPLLFSKRATGKVTFINSRQIISNNGGDVRALDSNTLNFLVEKDFTRYFKATWVLWSISQNNEYHSPSSVYPSKETIEKDRIASIGPILEYDRRDNPFVTHSGYYTKFAVDYGIPQFGSSSTVHYFRNTAQINGYVPTKLLRATWASSIAGGYLMNTENRDSTSVPIVKTFTLGGQDTIRGYAPNEIPPATDKNGKSVSVMNDSYFYLLKSELRVPVYGQLESVVFYDAGSVFIQGNQFNYPYRDSVGVGIRYQTPVGPLSLEYGRKLERDRTLDESAGRFHLSFGTF